MRTTSSRQVATPGQESQVGELDDEQPGDALEQAELPVAATCVTLMSGRRVELRASSDGDEVVVRAAGGGEVVRIELTGAGAVVRVMDSPVELRASRRLTLSADDLELCARRDLHLSAGGTIALDASCLALASGGSASVRAGGDLTTLTAGTHHVVARGPARMEAASVEIQASEQSVRVRAMEGVRLDAEHIGLNDDPCPTPFSWSSIADSAVPGAATPPCRPARSPAVTCSEPCATERATHGEQDVRRGHD